MYVLAPNGFVERYPYSISQLKSENPNVSFPSPLDSFTLSEWGVFPVKPVEPTYNFPFENATELQPIFLNNEWVQQWSITPASSQEVQDRSSVQAASVREDRNQRLANSDWTQLPDARADRIAWGIYRTALRQIPEQEGFPWTIEWPAEPDSAQLGPDYNTFYNGLLISPAYQSIRSQAVNSLFLTVACTEFVAAISDAKLGIPNPPALQASINNVIMAVTLTAEERNELQGLLAVANMDGIYTLP